MLKGKLARKEIQRFSVKENQNLESNTVHPKTIRKKAFFQKNCKVGSDEFQFGKTSDVRCELMFVFGSVSRLEPDFCPSLFSKGKTSFQTSMTWGVQYVNFRG